MSTLQQQRQTAKLFLLSLDNKILREYSVSEQITVGRLSSANICLDSDEVSRIHAQIFSTPQGFFVSDLGSTNGTYLNGQLLEPNRLTPLKSQDILEFGHIRLAFHVNININTHNTNINTSSNTPVNISVEGQFSSPLYASQVHNFAREDFLVKKALDNLKKDNIHAKQKLLTSLRHRLKKTTNSLKQEEFLPLENSSDASLHENNKPSLTLTAPLLLDSQEPVSAPAWIPPSEMQIRPQNLFTQQQDIMTDDFESILPVQQEEPENINNNNELQASDLEFLKGWQQNKKQDNTISPSQVSSVAYEQFHGHADRSLARTKNPLISLTGNLPYVLALSALAALIFVYYRYSAVFG